MLNIDRVIEIIESSMDGRLKKFWESYKKNKSIAKIIKETGFNRQTAYRYKKHPTIKALVELMSSDIEAKPIPSIIWLLKEAQEKYRTAETEDDKKYWFKMIMDHKKKFGEIIEKDDLELANKSVEELFNEFNSLYNDVLVFIRKNNWKNIVEKQEGESA